MIIANKYKLMERIGKGEFGTIFKGENIRTKELVAIKMESISSEIKLLKREAQIYQYLGRAQGIPQVKWYGTIDDFNYMVLPLFSNSLFQNTFSLVESLSIGKKIVRILQYVHEKYLIHRDVKPENFLLGQDGKSVYIIDFGLCKKYTDENDEHIEIKTGKSLIGTPNYVSVNVHDGLEPSRRDDLISVAYIILHLVNGGLPWQSPRENKIIKLQKMCVLEWVKTPPELIKYLNYCKKLEFDETPDYDYLISTLNTI